MTTRIEPMKKLPTLAEVIDLNARIERSAVTKAWQSWAKTLELDGSENWYFETEATFYAGATSALAILGRQVAAIQDEIAKNMDVPEEE
jgi:hypothetical protein